MPLQTLGMDLSIRRYPFIYSGACYRTGRGRARYATGLGRCLDRSLTHRNALSRLKKISASIEPKTIPYLRTALITGWQTVNQSPVNKSCANLPSHLENRRQFISRDLFRPNEIRLHVDAPEPPTAREDKRLLRLVKEPGTKWGEMSQRGCH
jgi:hypothetical protein